MGSDNRDSEYPILGVRLLGGFAARVGERLVPAAVWGQRRAAAIVKLLALEPGFRLHREQVLDLLWPELEPESAANNLRVALHHARRGLEEAGAPAGRYLLREGDTLALGAPETIQVDVEQFTRAAAAAWQSPEPEFAERAVELYRGDLLPDDPFEDWAAPRREALRARFLTLVARLARLYEERGELARAIGVSEQALALEPLDEATHATIVRLHASMGQRELALTHYARFAARLKEELGAEPERETRDLAAAIREGRVAVVTTLPAPPSRPLAIAATARLPAALDALIGRERELAELIRLVAGSRLVTLTGPGGIGKTRLALETARGSRERHSDGVAVVDLASLREPDLVLPAVARSLGVDLAGGQASSGALAAAIGDRRLLLVLDNLEQVAAVGPDIIALLAACPRLTVLGASRARLRVRGEQEYPVSPLALPELPEGRHDRLPPDAEQAPAIALFVRRARAARPDFRLTPDTIAVVAAICRRLDGLPLAIELAAARVRVLTPAELLRRMARPLDLLGTTAADLPERQRTLRATIAWSYDLLAPAAQRHLRRLSVFPGGCTLDGAAAVVEDYGGAAMVERLADLIDQSLLVARIGEDGADTRFTMLETIREFAAERLAESGELPAARHALERYLLALTARAEAGLLGPEQSTWLDRLEMEHDNIRAALSASLDRGDSGFALALAPEMGLFWRARGYAAEGLVWLERALALAEDAPAERRATLLDALGGLAIDLGEYARAEDYYRASVDLWWALGDRRSMIQGLYAMATAKSTSGEFAEARALLEESLDLARDLHDERGIAASLHTLGMLTREDGELDRAISLLDEAMAIWRRLGDPHWIGVTASNLGDAYRLAGDADRARVSFDESALLYGRLGDRFGLGVVSNQRGLLEQSAGHFALAMSCHAEALSHFDAVGAPLGITESIEWLAVAAAHTPHAGDALWLFAAAADARAALGLTPLAGDAAMVAAGLDRARQSAGVDGAAALTGSLRLTLAQARDAALSLEEAARQA